MVYCMNQRKSVSTIDKKRSSEVISELEARFLEGEKLTTNEIVTEYLKGGSTVNYLLSRDKVRQWLSTLKRRFWVAHQVWFGCLDDLGKYGICSTDSEFRYSLTRYFSFIKGNLVRAQALKGEAKEKGFLIGEFKDRAFMLPAPVVEKKKEE